MTSSSHAVVLSRCDDYSPRLLAEGIEFIMSHLELPVSLTGSTVLLKPNLISSRGPALACTHPDFLAAVALWFIDHGAKVKIGDSPAFGTTVSVMARHSMMEKLAGIPVELVYFKTPVPRTLSNGVAVEIAAEALECDLFVNLPKLKAHNQMYMTGAVKNFFGIVVGMRKALLHMRHGSSHQRFADMLLCLPELLAPHLSLVDGIEVMHRSGPLDGEPLMLYCLGGSNSPVALDTALLTLLELPVEKSPLWKAAADRMNLGCHPVDISYPGSDPRDFAGSGFIAPTVLNPIRFNPFRLLVNGIRRIGLAIHS